MWFGFVTGLSSRARTEAAGSQGPILQVASHGGGCRNVVLPFATLYLFALLLLSLGGGGGGSKLMLLRTQQQGACCG